MPFSNEIVDTAWKRSGKKCECTAPKHGHTGRCNKQLMEIDKASEASSYGWKVHSVSGAFKKELSDCLIVCTTCYKALNPTKK